MVKLKEKWLKMWYNKEISKTEMYFVNNLDDQFNVLRIRAKVILNLLMLEKINEIHSFVRNNQSYSLNINKIGNVFLINTPRLWFQFETGIKEETILSFMRQHLKQVN